jgi:WD40 repeat protein
MLEKLITVLHQPPKGFSHRDVILQAVWSGDLAKAITEAKAQGNDAILNKAKELIERLKADAQQKSLLQRCVSVEDLFDYIFRLFYSTENPSGMAGKSLCQVNGPVVHFDSLRSTACPATLTLELRAGSGQIVCGQANRVPFMDEKWRDGVARVQIYLDRIGVTHFRAHYDIVYRLDFPENPPFVKINGDSASVMLLLLIEILFARHTLDTKIIPSSWRRRASTWKQLRYVPVCISAALSEGGGVGSVGDLGPKTRFTKLQAATLLFGFAEADYDKLEVTKEPWWPTHYKSEHPVKLEEANKFFVVLSASDYETLSGEIVRYLKMLGFTPSPPTGTLELDTVRVPWKQTAIAAAAVAAIAMAVVGILKPGSLKPHHEGIIWLIPNPPMEVTYTRRFGNVTQPELSLSADGKTLACIQHDIITTLNPASDKILMTYSHITRASDQTVAISDDGEQLFGASSNNVYHWNQGVRLAKQEITSNNLSFRRTALVPKTSDVLYLANDDNIYHFTPQLKKVIRKVKVNGKEEESDHFGGLNTSNINEIAVSPNGKYLATAGNDHATYLYSIANRQQIGALTGLNSPVLSVSFARDNVHVATGYEDGSLLVWNISKPGAPEPDPKYHHPDAVTAMQFSKDGNYLFSGSRDKILRIWSLKEAKEICRIQGYTGELTSLCLSQDGTTLAARDNDNNLLIFKLRRL